MQRKKLAKKKKKEGDRESQKSHSGKKKKRNRHHRHKELDLSGSSEDSEDNCSKFGIILNVDTWGIRNWLAVIVNQSNFS